MASGRQVTYTLKLNSNVSGVLNQAESDAVKLDSTMVGLQNTMATFGVALGANLLIDSAKQWTQGAADYETAMLRIKNASESTPIGLKNQLFINKEVDDFKLQLNDAIGAYGSFLFKIKNANISSDQKNKLFNEILGVGKVAGLDENQMKPVVNNIATMLAEGVLEARHLRLLSYSHPQVIPFLADILGLDKGKMDKAAHTENEKSALQQFSRLLSSGKLTKAGVDSQVLLESFEKYYDSVKSKIPETLTLLQSEINELSNDWERFKNRLTLDDKKGIVDFFHELEGGIHFLIENQQNIVNTATTIAHVIEMYAAWRISIMALQAPLGILSFFNSEQKRLIDTFGLYAEKTKAVEIANIGLKESYIDLDETEEVRSVKQKSIYEREVILNNQRTLLLEETIEKEQLLDNELIEIQESYFRRNTLLHEWYNEREEALYLELEAIQQKDTINYQEYLIKSLQINEKLIESEAIYNSKLKFLKDEEFNTIALNNEKILETQNAFAEESALINEKLRMQDLLTADTRGATNQLMANAGRSLESVNLGGIASGFSSIVSTLLTGITIAYFAGEAAEYLGWLGKKQDGSNIELADWLGLSKWSQQTDEGVYNLMKGGYALNSVKDGGKAFWESQDEHNKEKEIRNSSRLGKTINSDLSFDKNGNIDYTKLQSDIIGAYIGSAATSGLEVQQKLAQYGIGGTFTKTPPIIKIPDLSKLGKDTHHLKGNSSNYVTINIHEMNGVKEFFVSSSNGDLTTKQASEIAGDKMLKMLADAINDSQAIRSK